MPLGCWKVIGLFCGDIGRCPETYCVAESSISNRHREDAASPRATIYRYLTDEEVRYTISAPSLDRGDSCVGWRTTQWLQIEASGEEIGDSSP